MWLSAEKPPVKHFFDATRSRPQTGHARYETARDR